MAVTLVVCEGLCFDLVAMALQKHHVQEAASVILCALSVARTAIGSLQLQVQLHRVHDLQSSRNKSESLLHNSKQALVYSHLRSGFKCAESHFEMHWWMLSGSVQSA